MTRHVLVVLVALVLSKVVLLLVCHSSRRVRALLAGSAQRL